HKNAARAATLDITQSMRSGGDPTDAENALSAAQEHVRRGEARLVVLREIESESHARAKAGVEDGAESLRRQLQEEAVKRCADADAALLDAIAPLLAQCVACRREAAQLHVPTVEGFGGQSPYWQYARLED